MAEYLAKHNQSTHSIAEPVATVKTCVPVVAAEREPTEPPSTMLDDHLDEQVSSADSEDHAPMTEGQQETEDADGAVVGFEDIAAMAETQDPLTDLSVPLADTASQECCNAPPTDDENQDVVDDAVETEYASILAENVENTTAAALIAGIAELNCRGRPSDQYGSVSILQATAPVDATVLSGEECSPVSSLNNSPKISEVETVEHRSTSYCFNFAPSDINLSPSEITLRKELVALQAAYKKVTQANKTLTERNKALVSKVAQLTAGTTNSTSSVPNNRTDVAPLIPFTQPPIVPTVDMDIIVTPTAPQQKQKPKSFADVARVKSSAPAVAASDEQVLKDLRAPRRAPKRPPPIELDRVYFAGFNRCRLGEIRQKLKQLKVNLDGVLNISYVGKDTLELLVTKTIKDRITKELDKLGFRLRANFRPDQAQDPRASAEVRERIAQSFIVRLERLSADTSRPMVAKYFASWAKDTSDAKTAMTSTLTTPHITQC